MFVSTIVPVTPVTLTCVFPAPRNPVAPSTPYIPLLAKYVKLLTHSHLAPFVIVSASTPGVISVTPLNNLDASNAAAPHTAPSLYSPLPASPCAKPLGSAALVTLPFVITDIFLIKGLRVCTNAFGVKLNAYPV